MSLTIHTAPATEPVTLDEAKAHLRVTGSADDTYITTLIKGARVASEILMGRALITQTWRYTSDKFPCGRVIKLEKGRIQSVTSVKYFDSAGVQQTLSTDFYTVDTYSEPARVVLKSTKSWPDTADEPNAVEIIYIAGYGNASTVPQDIIQAILFLVGHFYANREPLMIATYGQVQELPLTFKWLLLPYAVYM